MYTTKRSYGISPRTVSGFMDDVFQNGWNRINEEIIATSAPVNIRETNTEFSLHLLAPGIKKEDIKLNVDGGILTISCGHTDETGEKAEGKWIRNEYRTKSFKRSFTLSDGVDATHISAKYTDGILLVTIPKKEKTTPETKEIPVN